MLGRSIQVGLRCCVLAWQALGLGTYQSPVLCLLLNRLAVVRLFTSAEDFRQFCQRNPEKGHRSSLHRRKTLGADRKFPIIRFLTPSVQRKIRTTMDAFNAADAQRHLQDVSEVSFLPRIHPCRFGTAPNRRRDDKFKTSIAMEANRAPPFGGRCVSLALPPGGHLSIHSMP